MATRAFICVLAGVLLTAGCGWVDTNELAAPRVPSVAATSSGDGGTSGVSFASTVGPMLSSRCGECHNATAKTAGLDFTSYSGVVANAVVVVPGNPSGSLMVQRIESGGMPPAGRTGLTSDELSALRQWILDGAPDN